MEMNVVLGENQKVIASYKGFQVITDQPTKAGGDNSALSPFDLFLVSIGTCAGWFAKSYCQSRNISEEGIKITQKTQFNPEKRLHEQIIIEIHLPDNFPDSHREPLIKAVSACTVKKHMMNMPEFSIITSK
jgi:putative redox protein